MKCPLCQGFTHVTNSRPAEKGRGIKRRRECVKCKQRFSTYERMAILDLRVLKRNGSREPYYRHKVEAGLRKALEKRPITEQQFQNLMFNIEQDIFGLEKDVVSSEEIGRIVLSHLKNLDQVAYLRFASVYRNFKSPRAFQREIQKLEKATSFLKAP